jgi:hypothetical protein
MAQHFWCLLDGQQKKIHKHLKIYRKKKRKNVFTHCRIKAKVSFLENRK